MSRIAKSPITLPQGVEVKVDGLNVEVKGPKDTLSIVVNDGVEVSSKEGTLNFAPKVETSVDGWAQAGTARSLVENMVTGVTNGFDKKLVLIGVGYRAQVQGSVLNLTLGFSHPVNYQLPEGITAETPSPTEVVIKGANKQLVGQVAAEIRAYRAPEPYKGKGIKYVDEYIVRKEAKKA